MINDVKNILDIPNIENYLTNRFKLNLYEVGDKTIIYTCILPNKHSIIIDLISDESLILGELDLAELLAHYDIAYMHWIKRNDLLDVIEDYSFRPLIDENEKNY